MQHLPSLEQRGNTDTLVISADSTVLRVTSESLSFGLSPSEMHSHLSLSYTSIFFMRPSCRILTSKGPFGVMADTLSLPFSIASWFAKDCTQYICDFWLSLEMKCISSPRWKMCVWSLTSPPVFAFCNFEKHVALRCRLKLTHLHCASFPDNKGFLVHLDAMPGTVTKGWIWMSTYHSMQINGQWIV